MGRILLITFLAMLTSAFSSTLMAEEKSKEESKPAIKKGVTAKDSMLKDSKIQVKGITLNLIRNNRIHGRMIGESAQNLDDGGVEVIDATFHFYPTSQGKDAKLGAPRASISAGKMLWYRKDSKLFLSDEVEGAFGQGSNAVGDRILLRAESMILSYQLAGLALNQPLKFKVTKAKRVVFHGLGLKTEAPAMTIDLALFPNAGAAANDKDKDAKAKENAVDGLASARLESLNLRAPDGAVIAFPVSFLRALHDAEDTKDGNEFRAQAGGLTTLNYSRNGIDYHPLSLRMVGRVSLLETAKDRPATEVMRASTLELSALVADPDATVEERIKLQTLKLAQRAHANINELRASGESIIVDLSKPNQREVVISIGAKLEIAPQIAAGAVRARDLNDVHLTAKKEIRILETRNADKSKQESALSALEEAEASFSIADGSVFELRGNQVHFTLDRDINDDPNVERARYSLRNLVDFACFGAGVRPLMTWRVGNERRLALFAEALQTSRLTGDRMSVEASGEGVRAAIVPSSGAKGLSSLLDFQDFDVKEIWMRSKSSLRLTLPIALIDPEATDTEALGLHLESREASHYEEMVAGGKTVNAIHAQTLDLDMTLSARRVDSSRRTLEHFSLRLGGTVETPVRMGIGTDIVVCNEATLKVSNSRSEATLHGNVEAWVHSPRAVDGFSEIVAHLHDPQSPTAASKADLVKIIAPHLTFSRDTKSRVASVWNGEKIDVEIQDSERVSWGFGDDAILEHSREGGVDPEILAKISGRVMHFRIQPDGHSASTHSPFSASYGKAWVKAAGFEMKSAATERDLSLLFKGPVHFVAESKEQTLLLQLIRKNTKDRDKSKPPLYAGGSSFVSTGDLLFTSKRILLPKPKTPTVVIEESHFGMNAKSRVTITGQEGPDPESGEDGGKDTLKADKMNLKLVSRREISSIKGLEVIEQLPPIIEDFRLDGNVALDFRSHTLAGDRLFYDRPNDRFVLGGVKLDTSKTGIEIKGIKRFEIRFPHLGKPAKAKNNTEKKTPARQWRIVGGKLKLRRKKTPPKEDSNAGK